MRYPYQGIRKHAGFASFQHASDLKVLAFSLLPFGSYPAASCETSSRQKLYQVLASIEPCYPTDKPPYLGGALIRRRAESEDLEEVRSVLKAKP